MGLLGILGEAARESYDSLKKDPAGNISNAMYSMNDKYERKKEQVYEAGERKARTLSDEQLRRHAQTLKKSGNVIGQEIAQREMERRGLR